MSVGAGGEDVDWKWVEETDQVEVVEARISLRHVPCALISGSWECWLYKGNANANKVRRGHDEAFW